ncbi:OrdA protein [Clohesyomyces aquaticus]|uniref:OrdA protein n=1 Tax=Clohesyomyces aquaticus TaxID=1231657 RepID=A0A1Y1ZGL3_9PLEO|nr:OrdA protein [Clohesyomyces aquaticus]
MAMASLMLWVIVALTSYFIYHWSSKSSRRKLPPGPKPLPMLGNINAFPPDGIAEYKHWLKHKDLYGGISSEMANELLEQHSNKTSGRPTMVMANKLCGYESIVLCQSYTPTFRRYRKYLHQELGTMVSAAQFRDAQEVEVNRQLVRTLREPEKWLDHFKTTAAATVLKMAYGYAIEPQKSDPLVDLTEKMMKEFSLAAAPMAWAVDMIPASTRKWRKSIQATAYIPYRFVQRQMNDSTFRPSYVSKLVQQLQSSANTDAKLSTDDEEAIIWTAASLYGAAADTTVITLKAFTLAMLKFPSVQQQAQSEIDRVIGRTRLPTFTDRENLPYVNALVKEAMRWWPIAPMGFPHTATEDFEFNGFHIPKNAFLLPAVWWFTHDPDVYANPEVFDPERFLAPRNEPDPASEVFGYGRRICPGRFFADSSLYLNIVQSLAAFRIRKAVGKDRKEIEVEGKPKPGILTYPGEFEFRVEPRAAEYVDLIVRIERAGVRKESDAERLDSVEEFEVIY